MENWKNIKEYEGLYQVSNKARVKSTRGILKQYTNNSGYNYVCLYINGKKNNKTVHKLVAEAFISNPDNKPCVDHIIPLSMGGTNCADNLRWVTSKENNNNLLTKEKQIKSKLGKPSNNKGSKWNEETKKKHAISIEKQKKKVYQYTLNGELVKVWESVAECDRNGYASSAVSYCCNNKRKTAYGFLWSYSSLN